jgi:hypothetical protein
MFGSPYFENDQSYEHLKGIENALSETKDNKIFSNSVNFEGFKAYYIFVFPLAQLIDSGTAAKIVDLLFFAALFYFIFILTRDLTESNFAALASVVLVGVMPLLFIDPNNVIKPEIMILVIILASIYLLLKSSILFESNIKDQEIRRIFRRLDGKRTRKYFKSKYILGLTIVTIISSFFASFTLIIVSQLLVFLVLSYIENYSDKSYFREFTVFFLLIISEVFAFFNRDVLKAQKTDILTGNVPEQLLYQYNLQFSLPAIFALVGIIVVLGGIYSVYYFFNNKKLKEHKKIMFYGCVIFCITLAIIFRVGNPFFLLLLGGLLLSMCLSANFIL